MLGVRAIDTYHSPKTPRLPTHREKEEKAGEDKKGASSLGQ